jgi:DNA helicase-2/ATP-dependent DNA helicase PcrA
MVMLPYDYEKLFGSLNENQTEALKAHPNALLQVVAGPGTGKTKLLVSKVAYLLVHHRIPASGIMVTTFTKKAANEMKERLESLLKDHPGMNLDKLQIGTFHRICLGYLRHYGAVVGIGNNFKIADPKDQKELMNQAITASQLDGIKSNQEDVKTMLAYVSWRKALGQHPDEVTMDNSSDPLENQKYQVYAKYHELMTKNSFLDFDDILVYTDKLLTMRPRCAAHIKHILVDEFQDTNTIQLKLVFKFAKYCNNNVTIVGDADQSIYGFRNATYENFKNMEEHALKSNTQFIKITLDQNYRSTDAILKVAECVMRGQKDREEKMLVSNSKLDTPVYYACHNTPFEEPVFIAEKIKKLIAESNQGYAYRSFAVIVRASRTFLGLEKELSRRGVPYRIVKGHSFWELREISMTVDCMRITVLNDWLAYKRVIGWFCEGCGPKLLEKIEKCIYSTPPYENFVFDIIRKFSQGQIPGATAKAKTSLANLLRRIEACRSGLPTESKGKSYLTNFFRSVLKQFNIVQLCLKKKTSTVKSTEEITSDVNENLGELMAQLNQYDPEKDELLQKAQEEVFKEQDKLEKEEPEEVVELNTETVPQNEIEIVKINVKSEFTEAPSTPPPAVYSPVEFISLFLTHIHMAESISADDGSEEDTILGKVTLTTIHGAKGLEWPIVFVPSLMNNILPSKFALLERDPEKRLKAMDEERRCLYVALTRARDQLYMSSYQDMESYTNVSSVFLNHIPSHMYKDISPPAKIPERVRNMNPLLVAFAPQSVFTAHANREYEKWEQKRLQEQSQAQNVPPRAVPPTVVGRNGGTYNPVTGAMNRGSPTEGNPLQPMPAKKRRLGMGKPLSQLLPKRKP